MRHQLTAMDQAQLKRILHRTQDSPDIVAESQRSTALTFTAAELLAKVAGGNPNLQESAAAIEKTKAAVELARREFKPDFQIPYMYENTDRQFRDYYILSFSMNLPRRKPREAALAQAQINVERSELEKDAQLQGVLAEVQKQYVTAKAAEEQMA